jgi:hypothetical protein
MLLNFSDNMSTAAVFFDIEKGLNTMWLAIYIIQTAIFGQYNEAY